MVETLTHDIIVNIPISHSQLTQTLIMNHEYAHIGCNFFCELSHRSSTLSRNFHSKKLIPHKIISCMKF